MVIINELIDNLFVFRTWDMVSTASFNFVIQNIHSYFSHLLVPYINIPFVGDFRDSMNFNREKEVYHGKQYQHSSDPSIA